MHFSVVCSPGVGDLAILHIVSHHLKLAGHKVTTITPHRFGRWLSDFAFGETCYTDAIFLQHDNSEKAQEIRQMPNVYTFFGEHKISKHGPFRPGFDYTCNLNQTMVENVVTCLKALFGIDATTDNGMRPPKDLVYRRFAKRIAIHTTSSKPLHNWQIEKFQAFAKWAKKEGFEPVFLPHFPTIEELISFIYESGYFLGNDSGPGHLASYLQIPHLIIAKDKRQMRLWRPGWGYGEVITPPNWIPNWKALRKHWNSFILPRSVINYFKHTVLQNKFI